MKILVTGATGFIGREIVSELLENNFEVIGIGRNENKLSLNRSKFSFVKADITDFKSLTELEKLKDVEVIIHSAGLAHQFGETKRAEFEAVNVLGTENILAIAAKLRVKHFILIGSTAVYGFVPPIRNLNGKPPLIDENTATNPQTLYAESKLKGEEICQRVCSDNRIPLTIFRLAPVIGEANVGNTARLISAIDKNRFVWIGGGNNLKTLIYKRDVARACVELIEKKRGATEIFNLAAEPVLMKDFVSEITKNLDKKILPIKIPAQILRLIFSFNEKTLSIGKIGKLSETIEKWLSDDVYCGGKIYEIYGFKPQTSISEAIRRQIYFYQSSGDK